MIPQTAASGPRLLPQPRPPARVLRAGRGEWPALLDEIADPPPELHAAGRALECDAACVAIVGTRRPTLAGCEIAREIAAAVTQAGFTVVSGLAVGIDAVAHGAALDRGGSTVAIVGCGLDVDYPGRNRELRLRIERHGTVLSEHASGTPPRAQHFPARNRIIAGMALATVVVEGGLKSGSLITARLALDCNRTVFAVPGSIRNPMAAGPNELLRTSQAALLSSPEDLFAELAPGIVWQGPVDRSAPSPPRLDATEREILSLLGDQPVLPQALASASDLEVGKLALGLAQLEVRGLAVREGGGYRQTEAGVRAAAGMADPAD